MSDDGITTNRAQNQQGSKLATSPASHEAGEVERLRERLRYYESFDRLIQENIARSGELMREVLDLRERTQIELASSREELERSRQEAERRLQTERQSQRDVFAALVEELTSVQQSAERLSRRVTEAVSNIGENSAPLAAGGTATGDDRSLPEQTESEGATGLSAIDPFRTVTEHQSTSDTQDEPTGSTAYAATDITGAPRFDQSSQEDSVIALPAAEATGDAASELDPESSRDQDPLDAAGVDESLTPFAWSDASSTGAEGDESNQGASLEEVLARFASGPFNAGDEDPADQASQVTDQEPDASQEFDDILAQLSDEEGAANVEAISPTLDDLRDEKSQSADAGSEPPAGESDESRTVTVLVHGVPRAATALSLQRHLAQLDHVSGVEAREYAEGVLRLQVTSTHPLQFDDLETWEDGQGIEPVHVHADIIEVRLPGADF
ncbi:MAG: hypothetical protein ACR2LS_00725 [Thermomicrobiales bacterium]